MVSPPRRLILVRHGELALKSHRVRARLMGVLRRRIEEALERAGVEGIVEQVHGRHLVETGDLERGVAAVSRVFGITSLSVATLAGVQMEEIEAAAAAYARAHWPAGACSFAVRARRTGTHPYTSKEVAVATGSAVWKAMEQEGVDVRVDLDDPDWALHVEVRNKQAFLSHDRVQGQGGLPLGSQGRVVVWLSGEQSGVAAYLMMRRGAQIVAYHLPEKDGADAKRVHAVLRSWGAPKRLHEVELDDAVRDSLRQGDDVAWARFALKAGLDLAGATGAQALVTPETRASPWALRLPEVHQGGEVPVLRPLMGLDPETIEKYRRLIALGVQEAEQAEGETRPGDEGGAEHTAGGASDGGHAEGTGTLLAKRSGEGE